MIKLFMILFMGTVIASPMASSAATFTGLGYWAQDGNYNGSAADVSADGRKIAANAYSGLRQRREGARWYWDRGLQGLSMPDRCASGSANGISPDGGTIVGGLSEDDTTGEAFYWTAGTGLVSLENPGNYEQCGAADASLHGNTIVGNCKRRLDNGAYNTQAFAWSRAAGMRMLDPLPDYEECWAESVSADGSIVAGTCGQYLYRSDAFLWTAEEGMRAIGKLPGAEYSGVTALSADGRVAVGISGVYYPKPFRWSEQDGMIDLGSLPGMEQYQPLGVCADGDTVVGYCAPHEMSDEPYRAFIWRRSSGMEFLDDYLSRVHGLDTPGWRLIRATGISDDGLVIVGQGVNPDGQYEGWAVDLRRKKPCTPRNGMFMLLLGYGLRR